MGHGGGQSDHCHAVGLQKQRHGCHLLRGGPLIQMLSHILRARRLPNAFTLPAVSPEDTITPRWGALDAEPFWTAGRLPVIVTLTLAGGESSKQWKMQATTGGCVGKQDQNTRGQYHPGQASRKGAYRIPERLVCVMMGSQPLSLQIYLRCKAMTHRGPQDRSDGLKMMQTQSSSLQG